MINPIDLKIEDCYRRVIYKPNEKTVMTGVITGWNYNYILVNYGEGTKVISPDKLNFI